MTLTTTARPTIPAPRIPSSLTQRSSRGGLRCTACSSDRLTHLEMTLTDGSRVAFVSCHACERREWRQDGLELPIDRVLEKSRKTK